MNLKQDFVKDSKTDSLTNIHFLDKQKKLGLNIEQFNLDELCKNSNILMIGKKCSGKTWQIKNIIDNQYKSKKIDRIIVFSPIDIINNFYNKFVDIVYHKYEPQIINKLLKDTNISLHTLVVFDDCFINDFSKDKSFINLILNGRHYNISSIISLQFPIGFLPCIRTNFDYIFLFEELNISNIKRLYEYHGGIFPAFKSFNQIFKSITVDYCSMILINNKFSFDESVKWFKASNVLIDYIIPSIELNYKDDEDDKNDEDEEDEEDDEDDEDDKDDEDDDEEDKDEDKNKINYIINCKTNKYDVLCKLVESNNSIVNSNNKLSEQNINDIITLNNKIYELCK